MSQSTSHSVDARTAELLARQINTAFMNACGYGMDHPLTERACQSVHRTLADALEKDPMLSLILDRGSLFVEKHPVGNRFNPRRMVDSFNELDLESITFDTGVNESDVRALISVLSTLTEYKSLQAAEQDLNRRQSGAIRFNYIVYRKVTSDQKVVGGDQPGDDPGQPLSTPKTAGPALAAGERVLDQLDSFFSLGEMAGDPDAAADRLAASSDADHGQRAKLVDHLKKLAREVEMGGDVEGLSPEELFTAMNSLRQRMYKSAAVQQDVDRIMSESGEVVSEVDQLTYSTLVSLVREEYRGGNFSVNRMAQIINRMLPDARDLKRLLPRLRQGLLEEGMPLEKYNQLVHELSSELRGEHLVSALEAGAENVGMDVDEIVRQIQDDPTEAARLVVLAGELRQGGVNNDDHQLSSAFTDYIERVSQKLALNAFSGDASLDSGTLGDQIKRVQKELLGRMNNSGLAPEASRQLERELEQRIPQLRGDSKMALFDRMLGGSEQVTDTLILDWLEKQVDNQQELEQLTAAISERLEQHGCTPPQAAKLIDALAERLTQDDVPPKLPPSVLSVSNTALFLKHEVKGAQRYGNPFSAIKLLVEWLMPASGDAPRRPRKSDLRELLPELYFRIDRLARDLDLIGSLEKSQRAVPFLILPMTDEAGANVFRGRLLDVLREFPFRLDGEDYYLACTATAVGFDTEVDRDANGFIQRLNKTHQTSRANTARQMAQGSAKAQSGGAG